MKYARHQTMRGHWKGCFSSKQLKDAACLTQTRSAPEGESAPGGPQATGTEVDRCILPYLRVKSEPKLVPKLVRLYFVGSATLFFPYSNLGHIITQTSFIIVLCADPEVAQNAF